MGTPDQGCTRPRPAFDKYATTKSGGNLLLSGGLLAEHLTELNDLIKVGPEGEPDYVPLLVVLLASLLLNLACIVLSLVLGSLTYPSHGAYAANAVVPTEVTFAQNAAYGPEVGTGMPVEKAREVPLAHQVPSQRTPGRLGAMNSTMTVLTGLTFVMVAVRNSMRSGRYDVMAARCGGALRNGTS